MEQNNLTELIIAGCSLFVAILAFCISIKQVRDQKKTSVLSVRPILNVIVEHKSDSESVYKLVNNGLGPAIIRDIVLELNQSDHKVEDINKLYEEFNFGVDAEHFRGDIAQENYVLKVDQQLQLLQYSNLSLEQSSQVEANLLKIKCRVEYEDLYENLSLVEL